MAIVSIAWKKCQSINLHFLRWTMNHREPLIQPSWYWYFSYCERICAAGKHWAVVHVNDASFLPPLSWLADGRCTNVRCCARGGRGCAAVSADHCQLITVQPTQTLALWEPLHGPHQRGRWFSTCSPFCLPTQNTQHLHTEDICSQEARLRLNVNKADLSRRRALSKNRNDLSVYLFLWNFFCVYIHIPPRMAANLSLLSEFQH